MLASNGVHISSCLASVMGIQRPMHLGLCQNCRNHGLPQGVAMKAAQGNFLTRMQAGFQRTLRGQPQPVTAAAEMAARGLIRPTRPAAPGS